MCRCNLLLRVLSVSDYAAMQTKRRHILVERVSQSAVKSVRRWRKRMKLVRRWDMESGQTRFLPDFRGLAVMWFEKPKICSDSFRSLGCTQSDV